MSTFLLLVGLALFVSGAAMYMAHAARHDPRWVAGSIFMPPVVLLYYRRHWDDLRIAALVQAAGLAMAIAGALMLAFQSVRPEGTLVTRGGEPFSGKLSDHGSGFVDSERALKLLVQQGPGKRLEGRVHGRPFRPDRVELIDGVLRLREGAGFFPDREIAIVLGEDSLGDEQIKRAVAPHESDAPQVQLSWRNEAGEPETDLIHGGYRLEIALAPGSRNRLSGYVQIVLPDRWESYASGDVDVITSHLRYRGDEVDRHFDHEDTLHYVGEEYLHTQYNEADIDAITFSNTVLDSLDGRGSMQAAVALKDGRVGQHVIKLARNEFGWSVLMPESAAATEAAGFKPVYNVLPPENLGKPTPAQKSARVAAAAKAAPERTLAFADLGPLAGQGAVLDYVDGRREQGVLRGIRSGRLVVEAIKAGGMVEFRVAEGELASLRMNSGEIIRIAGAAAPVARTAAATESTQPAAPVVTPGGMDLTRFVNKTVKVVAKDGKTTVGVFRGINRDRLVIETMVAGGKVDYNVAESQLQSIDFNR